MAVEEEEVNKIKERNNEADDIELNNLNRKNKEEEEKKAEEDEKKAEEKAVDEEHGAKRDIWQNKYEYYATLIASSMSIVSMSHIVEQIENFGIGMKIYGIGRYALICIKTN